MRIEPDNKVRQLKLQTGRRLGDTVEIIQGAQAGERYVASGAAFLADGDTVQVVSASDSSQPSSSAQPSGSPAPAASK